MLQLSKYLAIDILISCGHFRSYIQGIGLVFIAQGTPVLAQIVYSVGCIRIFFALVYLFI